MSSRSNPVDVHVGNRLRLLRLQKGMTQEELGSLVGVSYQQIQKYETGSNRISASRLYFLAMQLSVGPEYFFGDLDASAIVTMNSNVSDKASDEHSRA
ncbi:helix-turn-helix domain-containing protein [Aureimonas psammosilenae]|uniref:helix-turn-helix domain-containing protein n=1 Tax=Aureimonas psammosilenae TaxID=2495496 RepID=UPI0012604027|nr:helix-turn-helix transcriptional regulator [Aureimonas psammosilenae]